MSDAQLVSVIIPSYNHAHYLGEAIESVLAQDYSPIEIIVVDDGSSDDPAQVASRYPNVRCIHQHNQGLAAARNNGLQQSQGNFLLFLDADDRLLPEAVKIGLRELAARPECAFVAGHFRYVNKDWSFLSQPEQQFGEDDAYQRLLLGNYITMHAAVLFRRDALEVVGGYDPNLRACEDYDLYLRLTQKYSVTHHTHVIAEYRIHQTNMSGNPERMLRTVLGVLQKQKGYIDEHPTYQASYQSGLQNWQTYYGEKLFAEATAKLEQGTLLAALHMLQSLRQLAPQILDSHLRPYLLEAGNRFLRVLLPFPIYCRWRAMRGLDALPRIGKVDFGDLRRLSPLCREFGYSRGLPVDRHYIEKFLSEHGEEIHGRCLEIGDDSYTRQFGGNRVTQRDVLHVAEGNPLATFVGDLSNADHLPSNAFDCIILTQTLHLIFDLPDALRTIHRILKPGGVLLATVPGISQVSVDEWAPTWYWSFTIHSAQRLFEERFGKEQIQIQALGNVLAATAFLNGVATQELRPDELDVIDPQYQLLITIRACKSGNS